jgi:cytochrome c556/outer membrane murein-binding lipoprotein Lpp
VKKRWIIGGVSLGLLLLLFAVAGCTNLQPRVDELEDKVASLEADKTALQNQIAKLEEMNQTLKDIAGPPPASLDNFFPPAAEAPVYLLEMFALAAPLEGMGVDLQSGDMAGVQSNYQAFKAKYQEVAQMVPEWTERFPMEPVDALGQAVEGGDPAQIGAAMGQVGQLCGSCHALFMMKAQLKYHWPDFEAITLTDPVAEESVSWHEYMTRMAGAFSAIANELQQGQLDNARSNFQAFSARFQNLTTGCDSCHTTPRAYFVDQTMQDTVTQLGQALQSESPDPQTIQQLSGAIGNESCMKCHLVHFPAVQIKERWEAFADLFE